MVSTGDLRPSLMELNLTGALWCTPDTDCAAQRTAYLRCTYRAPDGWALTDSALEDLSVCLRARAESAVQAGSPPQPVGEAFLTRSTRLFASAWLCGKTQGQPEAQAYREQQLVKPKKYRLGLAPGPQADGVDALIQEMENGLWP